LEIPYEPGHPSDLASVATGVTLWAKSSMSGILWPWDSVARPLSSRSEQFVGYELAEPTNTRASAESNGFLTLISDGDRLTGGYALGPEAGEWLQQAMLAIRARVPLEVLSDTIQPFPSFSVIFPAALKLLRGRVAARRSLHRERPNERLMEFAPRVRDKSGRVLPGGRPYAPAT
jgi:Pyridine nucleotide-disulphide oxidoreductase, dimerisation domain